MWFWLGQKTQNDLIDGKCVYSEYQNTPIIDYTKTHPIFSNCAPDATYQRLDFGPELS